MAVARDRPYGAFRFRVRVARRELDCVSVALPRMPIRSDDPAAPDDQLVLRRGFTGSLDLYEWWLQERSPKPGRGRRVTVDLLDDGGQAVTTWQFDGCRPVALEYSPLDADQSALVFETITLTVGTVEIL